mgnify:FL=1
METIPCPYCGTLNKPGARFCKNCGKQYDESSLQVQPPQTAAYQAPQAQPAYPQPLIQPPLAAQPAVTPAPKKRKGRVLLFGILIGVVGCCAMIGGYFQLFLKPIQNTGRDFLTSLQQQNYDIAYSLMSDDLQAELGSPEGLRNFMVSSDLSFTSYKTGTLKRIPGDPVQAVMLADLNLTVGSVQAIEIDMQVGADNFWQVIGFGPAGE